MTGSEDMRAHPPFRPMEPMPMMAEGAVYSPEDEQHRMEQARLRAEFHEQQLAQWEAQQQELAETSEQKARFNANLNELGMKIRNAVLRLTREQESLAREEQELAKITECLKRHLTILSALEPGDWNPEGVRDKLREALPRLEHAENDFNEAYVIGRSFRHTNVFRHKPGKGNGFGLTWKHMAAELARGLAFHLPLFLLLLVSWLIYQHALS